MIIHHAVDDSHLSPNRNEGRSMEKQHPREETTVDGFAIWADLNAKMRQIVPAPIPRIIASTAMTRLELVRMCRSRKRRIVKKWLRNPENYRAVPRDDILVVDGFGWICHPIVADVLRRASQPGLAGVLSVLDGSQR